MASYNPNPNLYNPRVAPDTQGLGPGITAAGNAFAGVLQTYGQNKRQDARRAEDRQWQVQDHGQLREEQLADYGMRRNDMLSDRSTLREEQLADYGMRRGDAKADKEEERQRELEDKIAHYGVTAGLYAKEGFADQASLEWAASRPQKEQAAALEAIVGQASYKAQQSLKQQFNSQMTPIPQSDTYQMTGNGMMVPPKKAAAGFAAQTTPDGETIYTYGNNVVDPNKIYRQKPGPYAPGSGLEPLVPKAAPKEVFPVLREDASGVLRAYDRRSGLPLGTSSKTTQTYLPD